MASEITPGQKVLVRAVFVETRHGSASPAWDVLDVEGDIDPPRLLLDHPHPPFLPLDDLREVLNACLSWRGTMLQVANEAEAGKKCCELWRDGATIHWPHCIVSQLRERAADLDPSTADALLARLGDAG